MQIFLKICGLDIMLTGNVKSWNKQVILQFHFLWISPYTNHETCNKAICHPYWVICQTGIEHLCWDTRMNDGVCLLGTYGLKWEQEDCGCYHIIIPFMRYMGGVDEQSRLVVREGFAEEMIQSKEMKTQKEALRCVVKELDRLGLNLASFFLQ